MTPDEREQTRAWVEAQWLDPGYRFAPQAPRTLLGTAFAVAALDALSAELEPGRRAATTAWLLTRQDREGHFHDPAHPHELLWQNQRFSPLYVTWQQSYFALEALALLGAPPRHPLRFVEPLASRGAVELWLATMALDDFQLVGNHLRFLFAFCHREEGASSPTAHALLDRLEDERDGGGLWGHGAGQNALAGSAHVFRSARLFGRELVDDEAVRATLALQRDDALFGDEPSVDLAAVEILAQRDEHHTREALRRAGRALIALRNPNGSFRWSRDDRVVRYSGLSSVSARTSEGDAWSTAVRVKSLRLIEEALR